MTIRSIGRALAAGCAALAVALLLAACGSAGDDSGASGATVAAAANANGGPGGDGGRDRTELAACLKQQGVELPAPPAGARRDGQGGPPQGGTGTTPQGAPPQSGTGTTPQGVPPQGAPGDGRAMPGGPGGGFGRDLSAAERRRMQAAFETCGGGSFMGGPGGRGGPGGSDGAPSSAAIARFVACVRRNGFDLPDANTTGRGPIFDDTRVDRDDPAFVKASRACQRYLAQTG